MMLKMKSFAMKNMFIQGVLLVLVAATQGRMPKRNCKMACTREYKPVCASNGKTYPTACVMRALACRNGIELSIKYQGKCGCNIACTREYKPVCASNGKTYPTACVMKAMACKMGIKLRVKHQGKCGQKISTRRQARSTRRCRLACTREYAPVCGSDGRTYSTACVMRAYACERGQTLAVVHKGCCSNDRGSHRCW